MASRAEDTVVSGCEQASVNANLNARFEQIAGRKERKFWSDKMNLLPTDDVSGSQLETDLNNFSSDPKNLTRVQSELLRTDLSDWERQGLQGWRAYFEAHSMADAGAKTEMAELLQMEETLEAQNKTFDFGYVPAPGQAKVTLNSTTARLRIGSSLDIAERKIAWERLREYEKHVLSHGWIEIVKKRNAIARRLGYANFYEWKLQKTEGMTIPQLFGILDKFEVATRATAQARIDQLRADKGDDAVLPYSFAFSTGGSLTQETDPYYLFENSFELWLRDFAAMKVDMRGATVTMDLLNRVGKYSNGFCHMELPSYVDAQGQFHPTITNFSCNAEVTSAGSGKTTIKTFLHEGGHAANFANVAMPALAHGQEFAPTSIALAEIQSMFIDSRMEDPDWILTYARNRAGEAMPQDLLERMLLQSHQNLAISLRSILAVPYFERGVYEMRDEDLTAENILALARKVEANLFRMEASGTPLLTIPHLYSHDTSAYYHGYFLAKLGVFQTREHFINRDGFITGNSKVGPELAEVYWKPGNSIRLFDAVHNLTGVDFSADAAIRAVNRTPAELKEQIAEAYAKFAGPVVPAELAANPLNAIIRVHDGDMTILSNEKGETAAQLIKAFREWGQSLKSHPAPLK